MVNNHQGEIMSKFIVLPIKPEIAKSIRETMVDQEEHRLSVSIAGENGFGPCRSCLKQFVEGDRRILFSYRPNMVDNPYNETGPIFIHAEACEQYGEADTFPAEVEDGRVKFPLVFRAYNAKGVMIGAVLQNGEKASAIIESLFDNDKIAFAHVRNAQAGCFVVHIDRANKNENTESNKKLIH